MEIQKIDVKDLKGFRDIKVDEMKLVNDYMDNVIEQLKSSEKTTLVLLLCIDILLGIYNWFEIVKHKIKPNNVIIFIIFLVILAIVIILKRKSKATKIKNSIEKLNYKVLDCKIINVQEAEADDLGDPFYNTYGKVVSVKTIEEEYCYDRFYTDEDTINSFLHGGSVDALIIKIGDNYSFQLISKK